MPSATGGSAAAFSDVAGLVTFTPTGGANHGVTLRVPYYLVPQATSNISTTINAGTLGKTGTATATVTNTNGAISGTADWYAWGLSDGTDKGLGSDDVRNVGVQAFPGVLAFAISTQHRWSNAGMDEFDIDVDVNGDGVDDYDVVGADLGALTAGTSSGQMAVAVFDLRTGAGSIQFLADAPTDSSHDRAAGEHLAAMCDRFAMPVREQPAVHVPRGGVRADGQHAWTRWTARRRSTRSRRPSARACSTSSRRTPRRPRRSRSTRRNGRTTPALGLMIVSHDNRSADEAQTVKVSVKLP